MGKDHVQVCFSGGMKKTHSHLICLITDYNLTDIQRHVRLIVFVMGSVVNNLTSVITLIILKKLLEEVPAKQKQKAFNIRNI